SQLVESVLNPSCGVRIEKHPRLDSVGTQIAKSQHLAVVLADRLDVRGTLRVYAASRDCIRRRRQIAGPVHKPSEKHSRITLAVLDAKLNHSATCESPASHRNRPEVAWLQIRRRLRHKGVVQSLRHSCHFPPNSAPIRFRYVSFGSVHSTFTFGISAF